MYRNFFIIAFIPYNLLIISGNLWIPIDLIWSYLLGAQTIGILIFRSIMIRISISQWYIFLKGITYNLAQTKNIDVHEHHFEIKPTNFHKGLSFHFYSWGLCVNFS